MQRLLSWPDMVKTATFQKGEYTRYGWFTMDRPCVWNNNLPVNMQSMFFSIYGSSRLILKKKKNTENATVAY